MNKISLTLLIVLNGFFAISQVGIGTNTPDAAAVLEINSEIDTNIFGGLKLPTVNFAQRDNIPTPIPDGLMIYLSDGSVRCVQVYNGLYNLWMDIYCMPTGPFLLGIQDFEPTTATPVLSYTDSDDGTLWTTNGDEPNTPAYIDTRSYGTNNNTADLTFGSIDTSGFSSATLRFRVAAFSVGNTTNGVDASDELEVYISDDNGMTESFELDLRGAPNVSGNSDTTYDFSATGSYSLVYDGDDNEVIVNSPDGTGGYSTIEITGLPAVSNLVVRIVMDTSTAAELWVIDNVEIYGNP